MFKHFPEGTMDSSLQFCCKAAKPARGEIVRVAGERTHILIFCTSLRNESDVRKIATVLENLPGMISWSVDLEDCDKVLRVVSSKLDENPIIRAMECLRFNCRPMPG